MKILLYSNTNETAHLIKGQYIQSYSESHIDTDKHVWDLVCLVTLSESSVTWKAFI